MKYNFIYSNYAYQVEISAHLVFTYCTLLYSALQYTIYGHIGIRHTRFEAYPTNEDYVKLRTIQCFQNPP